MTDVHDSKTRSYNMSQIKSKNTKPEIFVRKYLHSKGLRFRLHNNKLPGKPDLTLPKYHSVIFVNGCFWHGHNGCKYFTLPKTRTEWWKEKIEESRKRDQSAKSLLKEKGWRVFVIWECDLKQDKRNITMSNIYNTLITTREIEYAK